MPLFYCANNITGTLNMLEAARQNKVKKFVYASSSSVYGDEPVLPKTEGREGNLLSPYALTKRCDEEWAKQYTRHYGLDTYGLRYFNVFGRRQDPNGAYAAVIPKFIKQLMNGERPTINGDGKQSRDFTYIENVIEMEGKSVTARRAIEGGYEILKSPLPALFTVIDANDPRPKNATRIMKYKKAKTKSEAAKAADPAAEMAKLEAKGLVIKEWSAADVNADVNRIGFAGSPTKVKQIMSVVLAAGNYKAVEATEAGVSNLVHELIEDHTLG
jgi:hypothetical protein